jgi:hypothetical protein
MLLRYHSNSFNYSNALPVFCGSSSLVSLQYIGFVTLPPHRPWLRPGQAKANLYGLACGVVTYPYPINYNTLNIRNCLVRYVPLAYSM